MGLPAHISVTWIMGRGRGNSASVTAAIPSLTVAWSAPDTVSVSTAPATAGRRLLVSVRL